MNDLEYLAAPGLMTFPGSHGAMAARAGEPAGLLSPAYLHEGIQNAH